MKSSNRLHYYTPRGAQLAWTLLIMIAVMAAAAAYTLSAIKSTMPLPYIHDAKASPLGYTRSLTMVIFPILVLIFWFWRKTKTRRLEWKGLRHTLYFIVPLWCLLDVFAAPSFFQFPNCNAVLGYYVPGWIPGAGFSGSVPIEEFVFYLGSSVLLLLLYIWAKEEWFEAGNNPGRFEPHARKVIPVASFNWRFAGLGVMLLAGAIHFKFQLTELPAIPLTTTDCPLNNHQDYGRGFPLYFTFLLLAVITPAAVLWRKMIYIVNTQAMLLTVMAATLISLIWEVTLALPYGWWNYNGEWMIGIYVKAWYHLPIEAPLLWLCAGFGIVLTFELFCVAASTKLSIWRVLFGPAVAEPEQSDN